MHYDEFENLCIRLLKADRYFLSQGFAKLKKSENDADKQKVEKLYAAHKSIMNRLSELGESMPTSIMSAIMDECENKFKKEDENVES
jgi:hypothetical protein